MVAPLLLTHWQLRTRRLGLPHPAGPLRRPLVMGIVNVTPDSFSDGGRFSDVDAAVAHGLALVAEGADLLDVGGESTRPFSAPVAAAEELRRVAEVVRQLAAESGVPVSIDTSKAAVAARAVEFGAEIINDVTGLAGDPAMLAVARETATGVCVMQMEAGLDTGPVCQRLTTDIGPDETSSALHDRLSVLGAQGLSEVLARLVTNGLTFEAQSLDGVTYANRLEKGDGRIDFTQDARAVHDLVRGVHPWPGGFVDRSDGPLKIQSTRLATAAEVPTSDLQEAATVLPPAADGPIISCGRGAVVLTSLQRPGRRVISGAEFLRGARDLSPGMRL